MVYKRYITRNGKTFGPYYYESYRDKKGRIKTRFISGPSKKDKIINKINPKINKNLKKGLFALFLCSFIIIFLIIFFIGVVQFKNINKLSGFQVFGNETTANQTGNNCVSVLNCTDWTVCVNEIQRKTCIDEQNCDNVKKINGYFYWQRNCTLESEMPEISGLNETKPVELVLECSEWRDCESSYNLDDLIKGNVFLKGMQSRICKDKNKLNPDIIDRRECIFEIPVKVKKVSKCFKNYIEIYDFNDTLISKMELVNGIQKELNIQFSFDKSDYCFYCYDRKKNFDEDETDCNYEEGKGCKVCKNV